MNLDQCFDDNEARAFVNHCKSKFGWTDLSKDVVMDLGCGGDAVCGKSILEKFPDVQAIIAIDKNPTIVQMLKLAPKEKIHCNFGDIEQRSSLQYYESKMAKVISTHMFHEVKDKQQAFENVFHLLKSGGEAAIMFVTSHLYEWMMEIVKIPKWKKIAKRHFFDNLFPDEFRPLHCKEMVQEIGFRIVYYSEKQKFFPMLSDEFGKDVVYLYSRNGFDVPPECIAEFKEDSFQKFLKIFGRNEKGEPCYNYLEMSLLLVKPA